MNPQEFFRKDGAFQQGPIATLVMQGHNETNNPKALIEWALHLHFTLHKMLFPESVSHDSTMFWNI